MEQRLGRLADKVALITGGGRGIGRGIALRFAREGARIAILDRALDAAEEVAAEIAALGAQTLAIGADVTSESDVAEAVARTASALGAVTVLVNNAAVMPTGRLHETAPADFDRCIAVNLRGAYLTSRAVIPGMIEEGNGSIIHMSSVTGILGLP
ncbi:MAG: SDR family NAD(P)-dependent oxidoreductase, partial [Caldilineaceae bacterium]